MKRSFADYVRYFMNDRTAEGMLARLAKDDLAFLDKELDDKKIYAYLINSEKYSEYRTTIVFLYHRYLMLSK